MSAASEPQSPPAACGMRRQSPLARDCILALLALCAVIVALFYRVHGFDFLNWDDDRMLLLNPHVQGLTAGHLRWMFTDSTYNRLYMPLGWLGYALSVAAFGLSPQAHHLINLALHAANAMLVFALLLQLLQRATLSAARSPRQLVAAAWFGATLWAIHPLRVEVVAWVGARVHSMAALFGLLSACLYVLSTRPDLRPARRRLAYAGSLLSYALSLLTFPAALMLPVVYFILDLYLLRPPSAPTHAPTHAPRRRIAFLALNIAPFLFIALIPVAVSFWGRLHTVTLTRAPTLAEFSIPARIAQAFYVLAHDAYVQFLPLHLSPIYTRLVHVSPWEPVFIFSAVAVLLVTAVGYLYRRAHPCLWAAWLCHIALLIPFLGLTEHPFYASDRYTYLQGVVWTALAAGALLELTRSRALGRMRLVLPALAGALLVACFALSFAQTRIWRNTETLFHYVIAELGPDPYAADMRTRLANVYLGRDRFADAAREIESALAIAPGYPPALRAKGSLLLTLADNARQSHQGPQEYQPLYQQAAAAFDQEFQRNHTMTALLNAARAHALAGQTEAAVMRVQRAIQADPNDPGFLLDLAFIDVIAGNDAEAAAQVQRADALDPQHAAEHRAALSRWKSERAALSPNAASHPALPPTAPSPRAPSPAFPAPIGPAAPR